MTLVTLRPDSTVSNTGTVAGTSGGAHVALNDNSDASYITFIAGNTARLGLADLALPAGAVVKEVALRVRLANVGPVGSFTARAESGGVTSAGGTTSPSWSTPTTIVVGSAVTGWSDPAADAATLWFDLASLEGNEEIRVYEAYFDVTYVVKPFVIIDEP